MRGCSDRMWAINPLTSEIMSNSPLRLLIWVSTCGLKRSDHLTLVTTDAMSGRRTCLIFDAGSKGNAARICSLVGGMLELAKKVVATNPFAVTTTGKRKEPVQSPKSLKSQEVERRRLKPRRVLGVGAFGEVYRASYRKGGVERDVAVKILKAKTGTAEHAAFVRECVIMASLEAPTICTMVGCALTEQPCLLIVELHKFVPLNSCCFKGHAEQARSDRGRFTAIGTAIFGQSCCSARIRGSVSPTLSG